MEGFESDQAMSLFPTRVGIGTPSETAFVDAEVTVDPASASSDLDGAVQAISFPISVRGPICLRNVGTNEDEEPLEMAPGSYEVLARFFPKKAPRAEAAANLRVYTLRLSFRPPGSLGAPRCIALAYGPLPEYGAR